MTEPKTAYPKRNPGTSAHTTSAFARPLGAARAHGLSDSSPRVNTGELPRPFKPGDSIPPISTGDLLRPIRARACRAHTVARLGPSASKASPQRKQTIVSSRGELTPAVARSLSGNVFPPGR